MTTAMFEAYRERLEHTLPRVRARIEEAARASDRECGAVTLVAVTKGHPVEAVAAAAAAGIRHVGENRIEELEEKRATGIVSGVHWHFIGHVQSRKAARVFAASDLIHSVDSLKLARRFSAAAAEVGGVARVLVQVNTSGEEAKGGFEGGDVVERIHEVAELPSLEVLGLMTMAPFVDDEGVLRATFGGLRTVSEQVRAVTNRVGSELSMGMTNDLEVAVREGSTMVRIGTALFGERQGT